MKKGAVFTFVMLLVITSLLGQKQNNIWCFGYGAGINFNSGSPVSFSGVAINQLEGCSSIADANGNLLFYTDGDTVWNKNNVAMPNGTGLLGNFSSTQSGLIVKQPGNSNLYYVFTTDAFGNGFNYNVVDMNLQSGLGDVTVKNVNLLPACDEKLAALYHCNNKDVWIITTTSDLDTIDSYLLTATGLDSIPVVNATGVTHGNQAYMGYLKPSPSGNRLAAAYFYDDHYTIEGGYDIYDFDRSTGITSNPIVIQSPVYWSAYGVEFSPDGNLLYGVGDGATQIYQFNLAAGSQAAIINSVDSVGVSARPNLGALQLAPDGKIYLAHLSNYLGVINNPNVLGAGCNYVDYGYRIAYGEASIGLPNMLHPATGGLSTLLFSANDTIICPGSPVNFTTLSDSAISYSWSFPGATPDTSTLQDPVNILYQQAGYYSVQLIASVNCSSDTVVMNNYIHVRSSLSGGGITAYPDTVCASYSTQLTVTGVNDSIQWQSSTDGLHYTDIPQAQSPAYTTPAPSQTTDYRVVAKVGVCSDTSAPFTLVVYPLPAPVLTAPDSIFCTGDSAQVCTTIPYASYQWNTTDTTPCTIATAAGGYWLTVTDANHCSVVSGHQQITVYPTPSVSIVQQGDTLSSYGQSGYQWIKDGTPIDSATSSVYVAYQSGSYAVQVTDTNGCTTTSTPVFLTTIDNLTEENISIYPNPSVGNWQLTVGNELVGSALEVFDDEGRLVFKSAIRDLQSEINLDVPSGVYYLRISNDNVSVVKKLVKL